MTTMPTNKTTATVRVALSYNFSTFEASTSLENPDGITLPEIEAAISECQGIAQNAIDEFKKTHPVEAQTPYSKPKFKEVPVEQIQNLRQWTPEIQKNRENATKKPLKTKINGKD